MAIREVKIGLMSYYRADSPEDSPLWGFALLGEKVDVHDSDLDRFDRLNQAAPPLASSEPVPAAAVTAEEPPRAGRGSGLDAWLDYAMEIGLEVPEDASRDDVIALVDAKK